MKILITSCNTSPEGWHDQEERLRRLWNLSDKRHPLTEDSREADMIIITGLNEDDDYADLRANPLVRDHCDKCFAVFDGDFPRPLLRGIYPSISKKTWFSHRFRSGCYGLYHFDFRNPYVDDHPGNAYDMEKEYLYCFAGRISHKVRKVILDTKPRRPDIMLTDTSNFFLFSHEGVEKRVKEQEWFGGVLEKSKFSLCPRGAGTCSIRLFETMKIGVAPVILSDDWILPDGPDWNEFAILIPEKDAHRIEEIVGSREADYKPMGEAAQKAYESHFSDTSYFNYLVDQCGRIAKGQRVPESVFWKLRHLVIPARKLKTRARVMIKGK